MCLKKCSRYKEMAGNKSVCIVTAFPILLFPPGRFHFWNRKFPDILNVKKFTQTLFISLTFYPRLHKYNQPIFSTKQRKFLNITSFVPNFTQKQLNLMNLCHYFPNFPTNIHSREKEITTQVDLQQKLRMSKPKFYLHRHVCGDI